MEEVLTEGKEVLTEGKGLISLLIVYSVHLFSFLPDPCHRSRVMYVMMMLSSS